MATNEKLTFAAYAALLSCTLQASKTQVRRLASCLLSLPCYIECLATRITGLRQPERFSVNEQRASTWGVFKDHICLLHRASCDLHRACRLQRLVGKLERPQFRSYTAQLPALTTRDDSGTEIQRQQNLDVSSAVYLQLVRVPRFHRSKSRIPLMHVLQPTESPNIPRFDCVSDR